MITVDPDPKIPMQSTYSIHLCSGANFRGAAEIADTKSVRFVRMILTNYKAIRYQCDGRFTYNLLMRDVARFDHIGMRIDYCSNLQAVRFELTTSFRIGGYSSGVSATHPHLHGAIGQNRTDFPPPSTACVDHNHHNGIHGGDGTDSNLQAFRRTCFQDRLVSNSDHPRILLLWRS